VPLIVGPAVGVLPPEDDEELLELVLPPEDEEELLELVLPLEDDEELLELVLLPEDDEELLELVLLPEDEEEELPAVTPLLPPVLASAIDEFVLSLVAASLQADRITAAVSNGRTLRKLAARPMFITLLATA
jgi:hypothetical protein